MLIGNSCFGIYDPHKPGSRVTPDATKYHTEQEFLSSMTFWNLIFSQSAAVFSGCIAFIYFIVFQIGLVICEGLENWRQEWAQPYHCLSEEDCSLTHRDFI